MFYRIAVTFFMLLVIFSSTRGGSPVFAQATHLATGSSHTCALLHSGAVMCWGEGFYGQLGNGQDGDTYFENSPVLVREIHNAVQIAAGAEHSCAVLANQTIKCWGMNGKGELGNGSTTNQTIPILVDGIDTALQVDTGYEHSCALLNNGTVKCWGDGAYGKLGNDSDENQLTPVPVTNINNAIQITTGYEHTCALLSDNTVKCWGQGNYGQLGNGENNDYDTPVTVGELNSVSQISASFGQTCALLNDHRIKCWGYGNFGILGNGQTDNQSSPILVDHIDSAIQISTGAAHTCALLSNGLMRCWGSGGHYKLGNNDTSDQYFSVSVSESEIATQISLGGSHSCALFENDQVKCWGFGGNGSLGTGNNNNQSIPTLVPDFNLQQSTLNHKLVAHYPFDGNAEDQSDYLRHGIVEGSSLATDRFGVANSAYHFDGIDDYITTPSFEERWNHWSVSLFLKINKLNDLAPMNILERETIGTFHDFELLLQSNASDELFLETDASQNTGFLGARLETNQWYHVVVTYDGSVKKFYLNNALDAQQEDNNAYVDVKEPLFIGKHRNPAAQNFFNGVLDDIRIYDRVLSETEIQQLYDKKPGLIAYYPLNGNVKDQSGEGNYGTVHGANLTADRFGNANQAYSFDGENDRIVIADSPSLDFSKNHQLTISAFIQPGERQTDFSMIVSKWGDSGDSDDEFFLGLDSTDRMIFEINSSSADQSPNTTLYSNQTFQTNQFYHVVAVWDGNTSKLYINGIEDSSISAVNTIANSAIGLEIGHMNGDNGPDDYFSGVIDELRLYNRALAKTEIQSLYRQESRIEIGRYTITDLSTEQNLGYEIAYNAPTDGRIVAVLDNPDISKDGYFGFGIRQASGHNGIQNFATYDSTNTHENQCNVEHGVKTREVSIAITKGLVEINPSYFPKCGEQNIGTDTVIFYYESKPIGFETKNKILNLIPTNPKEKLASSIVTINGPGNIVVNSAILGTGGCGNFFYLLDGFRVASNGLKCTGDSSVPFTIEIPIPSGSHQFQIIHDDEYLSDNAGQRVANVYFVPDDPFQSDLIAHYPFRGNANDESGNGYNGSVNGASLIADRLGGANGAYTFDGVDDYISTNFRPIYETTDDFSISLWLKSPGQTPTPDRLMQPLGLEQTKLGQVGIEFGNNGVISTLLRDDSQQRTVVRGSLAVNDNLWHHVAIVRDTSQGQLSIFIDGALDVRQTDITSSAVNKQHQREMILGANNNSTLGISSFFFGALDDFRFYGRALSDTEIKTLYTREVLGIWQQPSVVIDTPDSDMTIIAGQALSFQATGVGGTGTLSYTWDFGSAGSSTEEDPGTITFTEAGTYQVQVTVKDENDQSANHGRAIEVVPDILPSVEFKAISKTNIIVGQSIDFGAIGSSGNGSLRYQWDFKGGATNVNMKDPGKVTFTQAGEFLVQVTVQDEDGDIASQNILIIVVPDLVPDVSIDTPAADVTIFEEETVFFTATGSGGNGELSYVWTFDGATENQLVEDPGDITFFNAGSYDVTVNVLDENSDPAKDQVIVFVKPLIQSTTHPKPENYYNLTSGIFDFSLLEKDGTTGFLYYIDENPTTDYTTFTEWFTHSTLTTSSIVELPQGTLSGIQYIHMIAISDQNLQGTPKDFPINTNTSAPTLSSSTHPKSNSAYASPNVIIEWDELPGMTYYYVVNQALDTLPDSNDTLGEGGKSIISGLQFLHKDDDYVSYFVHLIAQDELGSYSPVAHLQVNICRHCEESVELQSDATVVSSTHPDPKWWYNSLSPQFTLSGAQDNQYLYAVNRFSNTLIQESQHNWNNSNELNLPNTLVPYFSAGTNYLHVRGYHSGVLETGVHHFPFKVAGKSDFKVTTPTDTNKPNIQNIKLTWRHPLMTETEQNQSFPRYYVTWDQQPDTIPSSEGRTETRNNAWFDVLGNGLYYLHIRSEDQVGNLSQTTHVPMNIGEEQPYGNLILVAGGGLHPTNDMKEATQYLSNLVYQKFLDRFFEHDDIFYFNPATEHDIDGDGVFDNIVDSTQMTVTALESSIVEWAVKQNSGGPLYLYLNDHGGHDRFGIYPEENVTSSQLDGFLDTFQEATQRPIIVMIEACKSGTFLDDLADVNRLIITSADAKDSYVSPSGDLSFSQPFFTRLYAGATFQEAFDYATNKLETDGRPFNLQVPSLQDGNNWASMRLGYNSIRANALPQITDFTQTLDANANQATSLFVEVAALDQIKAVTAVITPPDFIPPSLSEDFSSPRVTLPVVTLVDEDAHQARDGRFEGDFTFTINGQHRVIFTVRDKNDQIVSSPPLFIDVSGGDDAVLWQLISFTNNLPSPPENFFDAAQKDLIQTVWGWKKNQWEVWSPTLSIEQLNTSLGGTRFKELTQLEAGRGYWVHSKAYVTFPKLESDPFPQALQRGWNLVGFGQESTVADYFEKHSNVSSIWAWGADGWRANSRLFDDSEFPLFSRIQTGVGYWVRVR